MTASGGDICQRDNPAFPDAEIEGLATGTNNRGNGGMETSEISLE